MEEDINSMHRYRDSIVAVKDGPYERTAFGAYVLFPWADETLYQEHHFYKSINEVNIGGLPFLPNATELVEKFVERLIDKSPEEIQQEGILPKGTLEEWKSSLDEFVLVGLVSTNEDYVSFLQHGYYKIATSKLKKGWQEAKYVALYVKNGVTSENGVVVYGKIQEVTLDGDIRFEVDYWNNITPIIKPVNYGISSYMMTTLNTLKEATELPELFMKSKDEMSLWRNLRRVSDKIKLNLDATNVDQALRIEEYKIKGITIKINVQQKKLVFITSKDSRIMPLETLHINPTLVFKTLSEILSKLN